jgi:hypothetical protein
MKILKKMLENSKFKLNKIKNKINLNKIQNITIKLINNKKQLIISDKNNKKIIGNYNYYGLYNPDTQIWTWANIIPNVNLLHVKYVENFRLKSYLFEKTMSNSTTELFFYQFLANDSMLIPDIKYLGYITNILIYLSEDLYVFSREYDDKIQFVGLQKINELF